MTPADLTLVEEEVTAYQFAQGDRVVQVRRYRSDEWALFDDDRVVLRFALGDLAEARKVAALYLAAAVAGERLVEEARDAAEKLMEPFEPTDRLRRAIRVPYGVTWEQFSAQRDQERADSVFVGQ